MWQIPMTVCQNHPSFKFYCQIPPNLADHTAAQNVDISPLFMYIGVACDRELVYGKVIQDILQEVKVAQSCPTLCDPMDYYSPWNSPGQNAGVSSLSLLQGIFPTQGLNPCLLHCRQILYQLSHRKSP